MPLKLKQEWAGVWFKLCLSVRCEHEIVKQLRIKEPRIALACVPEEAAA